MSDTAEKGRRLVMRVGRASMAFSTIGEGSNVVYEPYSFNSGISQAANLREALRTVPLLEGRYHSVLVMVDAPVLMVPVEEFDEAEKDALYHHAYTGLQHQTVVSSVLPDLHCVALFAVNSDLRTVVADHWDKVRYMPCVAPVWHHLHQRSYTGPRSKLFVYLHDQQMEVFAFGQNRFRFSNTFSVTIADDALYYILAVWRQLGMEPERDELYMVGQMPTDGNLQAKALEFVKRVYVINPVGEFNRAAVAQIKGVPYDIVTLYIKGI